MRLSRGRSTPTRRAIRRCFLLRRGGLIPVRSRTAVRLSPERSGARPPVRAWEPHGSSSGPSARWYWGFSIKLWVRAGLPARLGLALSLLVAGIGADHHVPPLPTDQPALIANRLHARLKLHG